MCASQHGTAFAEYDLRFWEFFFFFALLSQSSGGNNDDGADSIDDMMRTAHSRNIQNTKDRWQNTHTLARTQNRLKAMRKTIGFPLCISPSFHCPNHLMHNVAVLFRMLDNVAHGKHIIYIGLDWKYILCRVHNFRVAAMADVKYVSVSFALFSWKRSSYVFMTVRAMASPNHLLGTDCSGIMCIQRVCYFGVCLFFCILSATAIPSRRDDRLTMMTIRRN